jgi:hypothetical protein
MRHLKKFEEVDYGRLRDQIHSDFYGSESNKNNDGNDSSFDQVCPDCEDDVATCDCVDYDDEEFGPGYVKPSNQDPSEYNDCDTCEHEEEEEEEEYKPWGDENIKLERFSTFNEKKKAPKKKDDEKTPKRPDFKDFDGDGDEKEPMTKALKDKEEKDKGGKKFEKPKKGEIPAALAAYQKKKKK